MITQYIILCPILSFIILIIMIRHTILVKASKQTKNGQINCYISDFKDGDTLRLSQGSEQIYLIYRVSQDIGNKEVEINQQLMLLNGLQSGSKSQLEKCNAHKIDHLKAIVSQLDWKIINANQMKIAQQFLMQISVVWPNAKIPIYYDDLNFIVLTTLCDKISRLDINTTVEFIEDSKKQEQNEQEQEQQHIYQKVRLKTELNISQDGYLNKVTVSKQLIHCLSIDSDLWIVQNQLQFVHCPQIQQLIKFEKQRQQSLKKGKNSQFIYKRLIFIQTDNKLHKNQYLCNKQCRQLLQLSQLIQVSSLKNEFEPKIQNLSFEMLLNQPNLHLQICQIITQQDNSSPFHFNQAKQAILRQYAQHILDVLFTKRCFYILQEAYPYSLNHRLYLIKLNNSKLKQNRSLYCLKLIKSSVSQRQEYIERLRQKLLFSTHRYTNAGLNKLLHQKYEQIERWVKIINLHKQHRVKSRLQHQQNIAIKLFQTLYQDQIKKAINFIDSDLQHNICLISSFGSNGKTFMHYLLQQKGYRTWKIDIPKLNSPSLNFKDIDFYIQWVISHSPYQTLYFDDFDWICSKIQSGDEHRKKQKVISKLFLRRIKQYLRIFDKKCIITAKSQSNVDEELPQHTNIHLKNPSRQMREKAIRSVYLLKDEIESPIKKIKKIDTKEINEELFNKICQNTESLTFAAFKDHATHLTIPQVSVSKINDFSKLAGLAQVKNTIKSIIEKPLKYAFLFKSAPIKLPRGVLLYGATGNGKSAIGAAVKDEFKMKYFSVKGSDILSKYIGGSEAAVRDIFQKAMSVTPSIIFFDEFESIVPRRNSSNTGVNDRIVNQFLCYLDGVSATSGVYIIAATSRPDLIDPAILRPGRLDAHLFLDYPKEQQRLQLIKLFENSVKINVQENEIVQKTDHFSYSDMIGLFKELRIKQSAEVLKRQKYDSKDFIDIDRDLFQKTLREFKLSVDVDSQRYQKQTYQNFRDGITPDIKKQRQVQY